MKNVQPDKNKDDHSAQKEKITAAERVPEQPTHIRIMQGGKALSEKKAKPGSHTLSSLHFFQNQF